MTDDAWRRRRRDEKDEDYGPPLFSEDATGEIQPGDLSFGNDTGPLPHWTAPATGEIPRTLSGAPATPDPTDDLDVWSSFSGQQPVWRDEPAAEAPGQSVTVAQPAFADDATVDESAPVRRQPGRITIGTDPTDGGGRPMPARGRSRSSDPGARGPRPMKSGSARPAAAPPAPAGRDMRTAIIVGVGLAAVFVLALRWRPAAALAVIIAVLGLAAVEYFDKVTEKGYRPATVVGIVACVAAPLATYWVGETALPLVVFLAFAAGCATFVGGANLESNPMPNVAITTLGVTWIGLMGSFAVLTLNFSNFSSPHNSIGTDTLFLIAVGVAANDVGALVVGSAIGKTPLRAWISPKKTMEGLFGGTLFTVIALVVIKTLIKVSTWNSTRDVIILAIVIAIAAPLGDLTESMFKRNLDIKDFGTIVKGHGGVLDRFDGFLLTLPAAYYVLVVLTPWVK